VILTAKHLPTVYANNVQQGPFSTAIELA